MLVLIDESGCAGFKLSKGSTAYFIIGMIIFESFDVAQHTSLAIENLRLSLGVKPEFKFSKLSDKYRDIFFDEIANFDFKIQVLVVNKLAVYNDHFKTDKNSFYHYFVKNLIKYDDGILVNASIKIDGSGDKDFKKTLQSYLRKELTPGKVKKFRFVDSKRDNLIQLADMIVGAIARSYKADKEDPMRWKEKITNKIIKIWEFK
jgi:hypothetical protein